MSMATAEDIISPTRRPYADAAPTYWRAGWRGILPIPHGTKKIRVTGWTGNDGAWPSYPDLQAWTDGPEGDGNIALRLPPHVLGIDVDHYEGKPGGSVLAALEQQHGPLPATWRTTSRDDGVSGIRLYRIPEGLRWPGVLGPGIETVRTGHRYAMSWPSVHPAGGTYRWVTPDGATAIGQVPTIDELPALPDAWIEALTHGEAATDQAKADLAHPAVCDWLAARGSGDACRHTDHALARGLATLTAGESRHDAALALTNRLVWLAGEGHTGAALALAQTRTAFLAATAGDREPREAQDEWDRMVDGAVRMAAAAHPTVQQPDPCDAPFAGLIPPKEQPCPSPPASSVNADTSSPTTTASGQSAGTADASSSPEPGPAEHTSWWPRDLTAALAGEKEPPPEYLTRGDGRSAFYAGRVNGIIGPSESGKSWVALHAAHQAVDRGERVTVLDFEDSDAGVIGRLLKLGIEPDAIRARIAYVGPDERYHHLMPTGVDLAEHLATWQPALIVVDGFNAAMSLQGLNLLDNMEATLFFQQLLKPLAQSGAAVVYVDHTPKDKENGTSGGIGAQAKRAMTTGCTIKVDVIKAFGKGQSGKLRLYVDKDRLGDVRGVSAPNKTGHWFGDFDVTGHVDGGLALIVNAPEGLDATHSDAYQWRPTGYMERIAGWVADNPGLGRNDILAGVSGKREHVRAALRVLIEEGWIGVERDGQKHLHTIVTPYSEAADLAGEVPNSPTEVPNSTTGVPGVPLGSHWGPGTPVIQPGYRGPTGVSIDPSVPGPRVNTSEPSAGVPENDRAVFCKHCGAEITDGGPRAITRGYRCYHCDHLADGSERS